MRESAEPSGQFNWVMIASKTRFANIASVGPPSTTGVIYVPAARNRQGQRDLPERLPAGAAQRPRRVDQVSVDRIQADIDVEDHEGQQEMHQADDHGPLVIEHLDRFVGDAQPLQRHVHDAAGPQDVDPGHRPDDVADPERQHQQKQQEGLVLELGSGDEIGGDIARHRANHGGGEGDPDREHHDVPIERVGQNLFPIIQVKAGQIGAGGGPQPERINDDEADRHDQQQKHRRQSRCQQPPRPPLIVHRVKRRHPELPPLDPRAFFSVLRISKREASARPYH